jgi:hypothetical protein
MAEITSGNVVVFILDNEEAELLGELVVKACDNNESVKTALWDLYESFQ